MAVQDIEPFSTSEPRLADAAPLTGEPKVPPLTDESGTEPTGV
ncbi:hypothetical protein [Streptomyces sannanensis]